MNYEILERIKAKLIKIDENIKEEYLFYFSTILTDGWLGVKKSEGCMIEISSKQMGTLYIGKLRCLFVR